MGKVGVTHRTSGMIEGLAADAAVPELAEKLQLFGQFVGDWEFDWTGHDPAVGVQSLRGEWHFGWVLDGRAVQDVWILPSLVEPRLRSASACQWVRWAAHGAATVSC